MKNPAREKFLPMLSPYVDGELTPEERQLVEQHLANSKESTGQVADFRAADGLMRHALEMQADTVDWKSFADDVMSKVTLASRAKSRSRSVPRIREPLPGWPSIRLKRATTPRRCEV